MAQDLVRKNAKENAMDATTLTDAQATRMGLKTYLHGTSYNNSIAPTVSSSGWTTTRASFLPYQVQDGTWRMKFNINGSWAGQASNNVTNQISVNGVTVHATIKQAVYVNDQNTQLGRAASSSFTANTGNIQTLLSAIQSFNNEFTFAGDIELASKPTWAY